MTGMKNVMESRTVWAGLVGLFAMILGMFGYAFTEEDQEALIVVIMGIIGSVSSGAAMYYRVKATKKLG